MRRHNSDLLVLQVLSTVGGKNFVGVNYCAMSKYKQPKTKEQWDTVTKNLKVSLEICTSRNASDALNVRLYIVHL